MAGRGRGRGRGQLSFCMEAVGIGKGENLPPSTIQPTPQFPTLEKKEEEVSSDEEEGEKKKTEEEEAEAEEEYDEEEFEEETDYIMSYFDNGEEFGADSDDNMDEAIY
ncbi:hypothetical protein NFI96_003309 [Prochilodus magdalenae]|nr:hypothetical protein NFI96_003309 [Prochilodus magdalenae]